MTLPKYDPDNWNKDLFEYYQSHLVEYYRCDIWIMKRAKRLEIDKHKCRICGRTKNEIGLEVHHDPTSYKKVPYESIEDDLTTLCNECHEVVTSLIRSRRYAAKDIVVEPHQNLIQERNGYEGQHDLETVTLSPHRSLPAYRS